MPLIRIYSTKQDYDLLYRLSSKVRKQIKKELRDYYKELMESVEDPLDSVEPGNA